MKRQILANLTSLMSANELEDKVNLNIKVCHFIGLADFGMDKEHEVKKKSEIISALNSYVEKSNEEKRDVLRLHAAFIEAQNVC